MTKYLLVLCLCFPLIHYAKSADIDLAEAAKHDLYDYNEFNARNTDANTQVFLEAKAKEKSEDWKRAAEAGIPEGQVLLGVCYRHGIGFPRDKEESAKWFRKAAKQGNADGQWRLAMSYLEEAGISKDETKAIMWLRKAAGQQNAIAQALLGNCYFNGTGVSRDGEKAAKWWRKSAEQGLGEAQRMLGMCYLYGIGVPENEVEAVKWFRKSAEQGNIQAQFKLGECYFKGWGVSEDHVEAMKWLGKSGKQGHTEAQRVLGEFFFHGIAVSKDDMKATKWFRKSAEQGNAIAQYYLGLCYFYGDGVLQDRVEAIRWLRKAEEQGLEGAVEQLKKIEIEQTKAKNETSCIFAAGIPSFWNIFDVLDLQEIDIPPALWEVFRTRLFEILENDAAKRRDQELFREVRENWENYAEVAKARFDLDQQSVGAIKKVVTDTLTEKQYRKLAERIYQFFVLDRERIGRKMYGMDGAMEMMIMHVYPIILDLSEQQQHDILDIQRRMQVTMLRNVVAVTELYECLVIDYKERAHFGSHEETEFLRISQFFWEVGEKPSQLLVENANIELKELLTSEQKLQLARIKENIPEYLREIFRSPPLGEFSTEVVCGEIQHK